MTNSKKLSSKRLNRIREQGYFSYSDQQIQALVFGNSFAPRLCLVFLTPGVIWANIPILLFMGVVAGATIFLPNHPFDYIYNGLIRKWINGPKMPRRSPQLRFACGMASVFIASTIYFFLSDMMLAGYFMGGQIIAVASLMSTTDICIPSKIYNFFTRKIKLEQV